MSFTLNITFNRHLITGLSFSTVLPFSKYLVKMVGRYLASELSVIVLTFGGKNA